MAALREQRRANGKQLAEWLQKDAAHVTSSVEALVEAGLLQAHGTGRGRSYTLAPDLYRLLGEEVEYIRQAGFDRLQQEQLVKNYVARHGSITRKDVAELCRLTPDQAYKLLKRLVAGKVIKKQGFRKDVRYIEV